MIDYTKKNKKCQQTYTNLHGNICSQQSNSLTILKAHKKFNKNSKQPEPVNMVKTLSPKECVGDEGKRIKNYDNGYLFSTSIKTFDDINDLYRIIKNTSQDEAFVRGGVIDGRNKDKMLRRKNPNTAKREPATLMGIPLSWFMLDLDSVPFEVFDIAPDTQLTSEILEQTSTYIVHEYFPELKDCSFIAQFSNSTDFGPKKGKIGLHLFFHVTSPLYNYQLKGFANYLNSKSTLKIDTSLYNCVQLHYVAPPIIVGANDHIPNRTIFVKQKRKSLNSNIILDANPQVWLSKPSKKSTNKQDKPNKKKSDSPINGAELLTWSSFSCLNEAVEAVKTLKSSLHINMRTGYMWLFRKYPDSKGSKLEKAFKLCPRAKQEEWATPGHFETISDALKTGAKTITQQNKNIDARKVINKTESCFIDNIETKTEKKWLDGFVKLDIQGFENQIIQALIAGYGAGKTTSILEYIQAFEVKNGQLPKVLYIGSKRSIIADACQRLKLDHYEDANEFSLSIGTTINSCKSFNNQFDLVVIDEIDEALKQLKGTVNNLSDRHATLEHLADLIRNNNHIVLMQDLMSTNVQYLLKMAGKFQQLQIIQSRIKRFKGLPIRIAPTKGALLDRLYNECHTLNNNCNTANRLVVPCSSNSQTLRLQRTINEKYNNLKVLVINKKTIGLSDVKEFLTNPTKASNKYHVVIYSPSISTGVSLENPLFTKVFGFHKNSPGTGGPLDFTQSLFRNRNVKEMFIFIDSYKTSEPDNNKKINEAFMQARDLSFKSIESEGLFKPIITQVVTDCSNLEMSYQAEHGFLKNNSYKVIKWVLGTHMQCELRDMEQIDKNQEKQIAKQEKLVGQQIKLQEQDELVATKTPSTERAKELENNHEKTPEQQREFHKFTIEHSLGQPELDTLEKEKQIELIEFQEKNLPAIKDWELAGLSKLQVTLLAHYYLENQDSRNPNQLILAKHYFINKLLKNVFGITISGTDMQLTADYGYRIDMLNLMPIKDLIVKNKELFNYLKLGTNINGAILTGRNISSLSKRFLIKCSKRKKINTKNMENISDFFDYRRKGAKCSEKNIHTSNWGYEILGVEPRINSTLDARQKVETSARVKLALRLEQEYLAKLKNNENLSVLKFLKSIKGSKTIFDVDIMDAVDDYTIGKGFKKIQQNDTLWSSIVGFAKDEVNIDFAYNKIEGILT